MADSVWVLRAPDGVPMGAAIERRVVEGCVHYGDGPAAALDNAGRTVSDYVRRRLSWAAVNAAADRYEHDGWTLTREPLPMPGSAEHVAWLRYYDWPNGQTSIRVCDSDDEGAFKVYAHPAPPSGAVPHADTVDAARYRFWRDKACNQPSLIARALTRCVAQHEIDEAIDSIRFAHVDADAGEGATDE